jgi:uncharacterized protein
VPLEWGWDREEFLNQTCFKAGLAPNAWRHGARIQAFTTQIIDEPEAALPPALRKGSAFPRYG